jgi:hypothetical protein
MQEQRQYFVAAPCGLRSGLRQSGRPLCGWFDVRAKARAYLRSNGKGNGNGKSKSKSKSKSKYRILPRSALLRVRMTTSKRG